MNESARSKEDNIFYVINVGGTAGSEISCPCYTAGAGFFITKRSVKTHDIARQTMANEQLSRYF